MADRRDRIILSLGGGRRLIRQPLPLPPLAAYECQAGASVLCRLESFGVWVGVVIASKPELPAEWVAIAETSCATCLSTFMPSPPLTLCADTGGDGSSVMDALPSRFAIANCSVVKSPTMS